MASGLNLPHVNNHIRERYFEVDATELIAAATTQSFNLLDQSGSAAPLESNAVILGHQVRVVTAFGGATVTAVKLDVGDSDDDDCVVDNMEIMSSVVAGRYNKPGSRAAGGDSGSQLIAKFTATGGNFGDGTTANLTAGKVQIKVLYALLFDSSDI